MLSRNIRPRARASWLSAISTSKRCPFSSTIGPAACTEQAVEAAANAQIETAGSQRDRRITVEGEDIRWESLMLEAPAHRSDAAAGESACRPGRRPDDRRS